VSIPLLSTKPTLSAAAYCYRPTANANRAFVSSQARANFRELLEFWQTYYSRKGRDCVSLAFSSHLPFPVWQKAVNQLQQSLGGPMTVSS
jgi:hypothetical protein